MSTWPLYFFEYMYFLYYFCILFLLTPFNLYCFTFFFFYLKTLLIKFWPIFMSNGSVEYRFFALGKFKTIHTVCNGTWYKYNFYLYFSLYINISDFKTYWFSSFKFWLSIIFYQKNIKAWNIYNTWVYEQIF